MGSTFGETKDAKKRRRTTEIPIMTAGERILNAATASRVVELERQLEWLRELHQKASEHAREIELKIRCLDEQCRHEKAAINLRNNHKRKGNRNEPRS